MIVLEDAAQVRVSRPGLCNGNGLIALYVAESEDGTWGKEDVGETNSQLDEFTDFVQAIERGDEDTPIPQEHGWRVLKVFDATVESARTGREVEIDW